VPVLDRGRADARAPCQRPHALSGVAGSRDALPFVASGATSERSNHLIGHIAGCCRSRRWRSRPRKE
jgi:hypothetical protein